MKIVTERLPACRPESPAFKAYLQEWPQTWERGRSRAEAVGELFRTYANAWPERLPGLEIIELP
jgi:hypothetical protein